MSVTDLVSGMVLSGLLIAISYGLKKKIDAIRTKDHVWVQMKLDEGKTVFVLKKPDSDGRIQTKRGKLFTKPDAFDLYKGRRHFRYKEGNPFPYIYGQKVIRDILDLPPAALASNGAKAEIQTRYERYDEPSVIPSKTVATYFDQHDYQDVFSNRGGMMLILVILVAVATIGIIGLYIQR